ncbi:hypothetical protein F753_22390 [Stutzerimonas chloritidismutans AW-1]|uniref:Uncharacterized protein n=1 Tax=Stutzerimonas chloritidismutans AW-1 TaxID=1263865 RepID=V4PMA3_STUCH|nr:hypothetical protein F753_22390 [Stutzerimonas chloritidismutans AW-1]
MIQQLIQRLEDRLDFTKIADPARMRIHRTADI